MSKVTLSDLVNLQNETTAVSLVNSNSHLIEVGFDNTLSRDGTAPNSMNATLDMNSNRIINLPVPASGSEALRLQDLSNFIGGGTISTIPAGGTTRQYLGKNSSTNFDVSWLSERDVYDVRNLGVIGNGTTDDQPALQAAIDALQAGGGGVLEVPVGLSILCNSSITIGINSPSVTLRGCMNKNETSSTSPNVSTIIYSGTGSRFIDARDSRGLTIENLRIQYSSSSFTGHLIDPSGVTPGSTVAGYTVIRNCILEPNTDRTGTATLVNLSGSVDILIESCFFRHGAPSIRGQATTGQNVRTTLRNNTFVKSDTATIINGGESWVIEGNSFENNSAGAGTAFLDSAPVYSKGMLWIGNWFGDITASGTNWIDGNFQGMAFLGNQMAGDIATGGSGIKLNNSTGVYISGNRFELLTNAVNAVTASTGLKMGPNTYTSVTTQVLNASNVTADDFTLASTGISSISPKAVTYAKFQDLPATTIFGNAAGSTGTGGPLTLGSQFVLAGGGSDLRLGNVVGDISIPSNSLTSALATVNSNVGTFGSATQVPQVTVSGKGLVTAASNVTITGTVPGGSAGGDLGGTYPNPTINNAPVIAKVLTGYASGAGTVSASDSILTAIQKLNGNDATNANLTGDVTSVGNATTLTNAPVIAKVLTGYTSGAGTVSATDSILTAIQKLNGNDATNANLTGPITSTGNATAIASQTGTGTKFVVDTSPTLVTPILGVATATSINGNTLTTGTYTLTGTAAKTLTFNNSLTLAGTDATTMTFPSTSATVARTDAANTFTGHQTVEGVTSTGATGTGKFVFDTSPTLVTPALGTPSSGVLSSCTGLPVSSITGVGQLTNSLGADVALNNITLYFDGPSIAQGSTGTWWTSGTVTLLDNTNNQTYLVKLWDGTTVIASSVVFTAAAVQGSVSLSGYLASPAGNLRISVKALGGTTGNIKFNNSSNSKDSTISAYRIA